MTPVESLSPLMHQRLIDNLYVEAMVMADEARTYFDRKSDSDGWTGDVMARLSFTCESLKVTTRLMHIIAWLLTQRAWQRDEISREALADPKYRLGEAASSDPAVLAALPAHARALATGSEDLYTRVLRLQHKADEENGVGDQVSPARDLMDMLAKAF